MLEQTSVMYIRSVISTVSVQLLTGKSAAIEHENVISCSFLDQAIFERLCRNNRSKDRVQAQEQEGQTQVHLER